MSIMAFRGKNKKKPKKPKLAQPKAARPEKYDIAERQEQEKQEIIDALIETEGAIKKAALQAGIKYNTFWVKCQRLGLLGFAKELRKGR